MGLLQVLQPGPNRLHGADATRALFILPVKHFGSVDCSESGLTRPRAQLNQHQERKRARWCALAEAVVGLLERGMRCGKKTAAAALGCRLSMSALLLCAAQAAGAGLRVACSFFCRRKGNVGAAPAARCSSVRGNVLCCRPLALTAAEKEATAATPRMHHNTARSTAQKRTKESTAAAPGSF